jgi:uncharacterized repeat protein (TIGR02543 family)
LSYTVTFKSNYTPDTTLYTRTVTAPAATVTDFPANPARSGHSFGGWNTRANGSGTPFTASTTVEGDITVYAQWTATSPGSHTVTFLMNDGTEGVHDLKTVTAPADTVTDFPANPARPGYSFGGWNTAANGSGASFTGSTTVDGDITVYAQWTATSPGSYTVTFRLNDGTEAVHGTKIVTAPATTVSELPANPSRTGYSFGGWNTLANGSGTPFTTATPVTGDITVYAQWNSHSWTVTFDSDGGTTEADPKTRTVESPDTTVGTLPAPPAKTGYTFGGWYTEKNGSGSPFTALTTVSGNITVYAQWTAHTYTVSFRMNDGSDAVHGTKTVTVPADTVSELPANPSRTGYSFGGWNTAANGSGNPFTTATPVSGDITVYVQWNSHSWTVTFDSDGGTTEADPETRTVESPDTNVGTLPVPPTKTGYTFGGWYTEKNGGGSAFTATDTVSGNITVYALWTANTYIVSFWLNYGADAVHGTKNVTVPATTVSELPGNPSRSGYIFGGWNTAANGSGTPFTTETPVSGDIAVYAKWNSYSYTVTFNSDGGTTAVPADKTVASPNTTIDSLPTEPAKTGYLFGGWYTLQNGGGSAFDTSSIVSGSLTVYAKWDNYSYTVTFNENGGDSPAVPADKTVASPSTTIDALPAQPARNGYAFAGWNTQANGSGTAFTGSTTVSGGLTVYAQWSRAGVTFLDPEDAGDGAFEDGNFTLSKGTNDSQTLIITGTGYTNPRWLVDGTPRGTGTSLTITAADYRVGPHNLSLLVTKNGVTWSKDITFTVTN